MERLDTMTDTLTTADLVARTGATYRQIDYWCRQHLLTPARPARGRVGSGTPHIWGEHDAQVVRLIVAARTVHLPLAGLRQIVPHWYKEIDAHARSWWIDQNYEIACALSRTVLAAAIRGPGWIITPISETDRSTKHEL